MMIMERNGINQVQLSAATGIAVSRINNYLQGRYRTIRPDHLGFIAKAAGKSRAERSELVRTYLLDLLPECLHDDIRIETVGAGGRPAKEARPEKSLLPANAAAALTALQALSLRNAKARSRVLWFSEILHEAHGL
jgi:transcriptional regulator with XRE-family HTH domain